MLDPEPEARPIRVALVDDHRVLAEALAAMLSTAPDMQVLGVAASAAECRALLRRACPDVLVLDIGLPDGDGLDLVPELRALCPGLVVLVLTSLAEEETLLRAVHGGVNGFVPKHQPLAELLAAVRRAAAGEIVMPPSLLVGLLGRVPGPARPRPSTAPLLTPREREILGYLARGQGSDEIAAALTISPATVRTHIGRLLSKLGVHSRLEAVTLALRQGLIDLNE